MSFEELPLEKNEFDENHTSNLNLRRAVYEHVVDKNNFSRDLVHDMCIFLGSSVLEVGCSDGTNLINLREEGHTGPAFGVDIDPKNFPKNKALVDQSDLEPISYMSGDAQRLPFRDTAIDNILVLSLPYYISGTDLNFREFYRVLKVGGRLGVATRVSTNQQRHREFEQQIADYLGVEPPSVPDISFDTDNLNQDEFYYPELSLFELVHRYEQRKVMIFHEDDYGVYLGSLGSMRNAFLPSLEFEDERWEDAIQTVVVPQILKDIKERTCFEDKVHREYRVYEKPDLFDTLPYTRGSIEYTEALQQKYIDQVDEVDRYFSDITFPCSRTDLLNHAADKHYPGYNRGILQSELEETVNSKDEIKNVYIRRFHIEEREDALPMRLRLRKIKGIWGDFPYGHSIPPN